MATPPSQKRQRTAASVSSPTTLPEPVSSIEARSGSALEQPPSTNIYSTSPPSNRKRRASHPLQTTPPAPPPAQPPAPSTLEDANAPALAASTAPALPGPASASAPAAPNAPEPAKKKGRTNTPWTAAEEQRLKAMRDAGNSWSEIAKAFPTRTEGSVKKHWYKDMHYAEFAEDETIALREAIREYEANKWKVIGQKVGKPAKACEQYAKEHFRNL